MQDQNIAHEQLDTDSDDWLHTIIVQAIDRAIHERGDEQLSDDDLRRIYEQVPEVIHECTPKLVEGIYSSMKADDPAIIRDRRAITDEFRARLVQRWGAGLDRLLLLHAASIEAGEMFLKRVHESDDQANALTVETLLRLHARACLVAAEVQCLLEGGFAAGAMARWRTLHEIAIVALFLAEHGDQVTRRYRLHESIESHKAAGDYQRYCDALGFEPLDNTQMEAFKRQRDDLCTEFGKPFGTDYGWAAAALHKDRPTFRDIEEVVARSHARPFYKLASHGVHATPKGLMFNLGLLEGCDVMLAGPSNAGLLDPAQSAAISLVDATAVLLNSRSTYTNQVVILVLLRLRDDVIDGFRRAHEQLEAEHRSLLLEQASQIDNDTDGPR